MSNEFIVGFPPIATAASRTLILGSMPSVLSLAEVQYYGNPRNHFWPMLSQVFGVSLPETYEGKVALAQEHQLAIWDVIHSCKRIGSSDLSITDVNANDFKSFFAAYPAIEIVCFNGQKAAQVYKKHVVGSDGIPSDLTYHVLPSTSPAHARTSFEEKVNAYKSVLLKGVTE